MAYDYKKKAAPAPDFQMLDNTNLEAIVLHDLIVSPDSIQDAKQSLSRDSFVLEDHKRIWDALAKLDPLNGNTEENIIARLPKEILGSVCSIMQRRMPTNTDLQTYENCLTLAEMANRNKLIAGCYKIQRDALNTGGDLAATIQELMELADGAAGTARVKDTAKTGNEIVAEFLAQLAEDDAAEEGGKTSYIPTSIPTLDEMLSGGFRRARLHVVAARPSVGKSAFMLQMADAAMREGFQAVVYSIEMSAEDNAIRLLLATGLVDGRGLSPKDGVDWGAVTASQRTLDNHVLFQCSLQTVDEVCDDIRKRCRRGQCDIAFVDHLHELAPIDPAMTEYRDVSEKVRRLKAIAKECNIPVVLLCQLNRNSDTEDRAPELKDLRASGKIEESGDVILMLEQSRHINEGVDMWVRKNRQGEKGDCILLRISNSHMKFTETDIEQ